MFDLKPVLDAIHLEWAYQYTLAHGARWSRTTFFAEGAAAVRRLVVKAQRAAKRPRQRALKDAL